LIFVKYIVYISSPIVLVGIGSVASAQQFAKDVELANIIDPDRLTLVADETGAVTEALGCYRGWLPMDREHRDRYPHTDMNPYLKLFGMIFGFGSPGTIPKVLSGYTGDIRNEKGAFGRKWVVDALLQGSKKGRIPQLTEEAFQEVPPNSSLRPFELATLRLQTGVHIVANWGKLGPKDGELFTRMGGTFVFGRDRECVWSFFDKGILVYANVDEICTAATSTSAKGEKSSQRSSVDDANKDEDEEARATRATRATLEAFREAKLKTEAKADEEARLKAEEGAKANAEEAAGLKAEEETRVEEEEARLKAEEAAKTKAEEETRLKAEEEAKAKAVEEAQLKAEEKAKTKAEEEVRLRAEEEEEEEEAKAKAQEKAETATKEAEEEAKERAYLFQRKLLEAQLKTAKQSPSKPPVGADDEPEQVANTEEDGPDTVVSAAVDEEAKTRAYLFQRKLLGAQLQTSKKSQPKPDDKPVEAAKSATENKELEIVVDTASYDEAKKRAYSFQRKLLEAQLQTSKKSTQSKLSSAAVDEAATAISEEEAPEIDDTAATDDDAKKRAYSFQRKLLEAQLQTSKKALSMVSVLVAEGPSEAVSDNSAAAKQRAHSFQRKLLESQLNVSSRATSKEDNEVEIPLLEVLDKKHKNKSKNGRGSNARGFKKD
jgi:hypothetical protein